MRGLPPRVINYIHTITLTISNISIDSSIIGINSKRTENELIKQVFLQSLQHHSDHIEEPNKAHTYNRINQRTFAPLT